MNQIVEKTRERYLEEYSKGSDLTKKEVAQICRRFYSFDYANFLAIKTEGDICLVLPNMEPYYVVKTKDGKVYDIDGEFIDTSKYIIPLKFFTEEEKEAIYSDIKNKHTKKIYTETIKRYCRENNIPCIYND